MKMMDTNPEDTQTTFADAARRRWRRLGEELHASVVQFNAEKGSADFSQPSVNQLYLSSLQSGLQLTITADFAERIIRYCYEQVNDKSAGVPDGGILSMRESPQGGVEFYSADEKLTAEETRQILLEPILSRPEMAA